MFFKNNFIKIVFIIIANAFAIISAQNVLVNLGDITTSSYSDEIIVPVILNNSTDIVAGLQFDLTLNPDLISLSGVSSDGVASDFTTDFIELSNGNHRVIFYNGSDTDNISAGNNSTILNLSFNGSEVLSAIIGLNAFDLIVSNEDGDVLSSNIQGCDISIGDVVHLSMSVSTGDVNETVELDVSMENSAVVGATQFDIFDVPDYLTLTGVSTTDRTLNFSADWNNIGNSDRIVIYNAGDENISAGNGSILKMTFEIAEDAYADDISVYFDNITVSDDLGGTYWIGASDSGTVTVFPGYIEEPHNLEAQSGMDSKVLLNWDPPFGPIPESFDEDFESGEIPEGWSSSTNSALGWFITDNGTSEYWTVPAHTIYMCSNDDLANDDSAVDYLFTPALNVSSASSITLNFASFFDGAYGHTAHVGVSLDGVNFIEVSTLEIASEWVMETVDLSAYVGEQTLHVAFHSNDNAEWASGWAIDDVSLTFSTRSVERIVHHELTDFGKWVISAPKEEVISQFSAGKIPFEKRIDLLNPIQLNNNRPVEIDSYKLFRSTNETSGFEELVEVDGNTTTYLDEDVVNSTTYYYYVTAVYPSNIESGPTNTVSATPVEWVEISMSNGSSLSGQTDTLDLYINNESQLGLFYFEVQDFPDVLNSVVGSVLPTERTQNWSLDVFDMANGNMAITGISLGEPLESGNGSVCRVVVYPIAEEPVDISLSFSPSSSIQDIGFTELNWTGESANYNVTIETQFVMLSDGFGLPGGESTKTSLCLINTQPVYGLQIDIVSNPPFAVGTGIELSGLNDLSSWSVSSDQVGGAYRVLLFDNTMSAPIDPGSWYLGDVSLDILAGAPDGDMVSIEYSNIVISDINNLPMVTSGINADVYVGQPPVVFSIENEIGGLSPGGVGSFDISLENLEDVGFIELTLADIPQEMTVTSITPVGRFSNGTIDGSSGETEDDNFYFLGYEFSGIPAGSGPIITVEVEMNQILSNPNIMILFESVFAGDPTAVGITSISEGFGIFASDFLSNDLVSSLPSEFALHANYPNPFNPATIINYDLPKDSEVQLIIYDLMGRKVKTLMNGTQSAGRNTAVWYANDESGNKVSAGVYLARMITNSKVYTQKMVYMK